MPLMQSSIHLKIAGRGMKNILNRPTCVKIYIGNPHRCMAHP
jgi:hypothetical protein